MSWTMVQWPPTDALAGFGPAFESQALLCAALDATGAAVLLLDASCELVAANGAGRRLFGDRATSAARLAAFRPDEAHAAFPTGDGPRERMLRGDAIAGEPVRLPVETGERRLRLHSVPLRDAARTLRATLLVVTDLTAAADAAERAVVREHFGATRGFALGMAHELNTPLLSLVANLDFVHLELEELQRQALEDGGEAGDASLSRVPQMAAQLGDSIRETREAADRLRLSVRDLKLVGQARSPGRVVDLVRVLDGARRLAGMQVQQRARLCHGYARVPAVEAPESELCQLVVSLLTLAARSIGEALPEQAEVRLSALAEDDGVVVRVHAAPSLGLVAANANSAEDAEILTVGQCELAAAELGGRLTGEHLGSALVLTLRLPAARRTAVDTAAPASVVPAGAGGVARRGRVLVIDDEEAVGAVVRRILQREHDVTTVTRADDALVLLLQGARFDVILCDLMMPEMSGPEFYHALAASHPAVLPQVVFVTGGAFTNKSREFLDQVPNTRLEKPFDGQVLASLVRDRLTAQLSRAGSPAA